MNPKVAILMGSETDLPVMEEAGKMLDRFGIVYEYHITSAHRSLPRTLELVGAAAPRGLRVLIVGAGGAAHLPGVVAASTRLPVIGVPIASTTLSGLDSLLSIVQMPAGVPVATMAIGVPGACNAALYAVQMLALEDASLRDRVESYRKELADQVAENDLHLQERGR